MDRHSAITDRFEEVGVVVEDTEARAREEGFGGGLELGALWMLAEAHEGDDVVGDGVPEAVGDGTPDSSVVIEGLDALVPAVLGPDTRGEPVKQTSVCA